MGLEKNKIALSFEKAEYYTLQEASDYLNLKHSTNNITPKKLLKQISSHKVNTFIHFRMDYTKEDNIAMTFEFYETNVIETIKSDITIVNQDDSYYLENDLITDNKIYNHVLMVYKKLDENISKRLLDDIYMGHLLFLVDEWTIQNMALSTNANSKTRNFFLSGFLTKENLYGNPTKPNILKDWDIEVGKNKYFAKDIACINFKLNSSEQGVLQDFKDKFPYEIIDFDIRGDNLVFIEWDITINDLIILHKDLMKLEKNIINNSPEPQKESEIKHIQPRKGVSVQKLQAKEQAKVIARALWNNDKENKTRIAEMASLVYRELYNSDFKMQLPQNQDSLQGWIKDIAPPYAKIGGRPKN